MVVPDTLLDTRYNPTLKSYAKPTPSSVYGEPITYFTINYNGATVLDNDVKSVQCYNRPLTRSPLCSGIPLVMNTPCGDYNTTSNNGSTVLINPHQCLNRTRLDPKVVLPSVSYRISDLGQMNSVIDYFNPTADSWFNSVSPDVNVIRTRHQFRISSIPYPDGRGLLLQYNYIDHFLLKAPEFFGNSEALWPPSICQQVLAKLHFQNTTSACSDVKFSDDTSFQLIVMSDQGLYEHTMRYCILYSNLGLVHGLDLYCGVKYLKISYLGAPIIWDDRFHKNGWFIQSQGSSQMWCDDDTGIKPCVYNDPSKPYQLFNSRGYGARDVYDIENPKEEYYISLEELDTHVSNIEKMNNLTKEIYLREYSLGSDNLILHGGLAQGIGYVNILAYRCSIVAFTVVVSLLIILLVSTVVLHFWVLPKHYTSSALDVFRVATCPDSNYALNPEKADQSITLNICEEDGIVLLNNGVKIGPLYKETSILEA
ncbi:hypothetical protein BGZ76_000581 [Entomortierella beljakovae]|nr:hypothetical protein BGZ76_000581 [Entomortierella beljakovae]